jgi:hypothetical protein
MLYAAAVADSAVKRTRLAFELLFDRLDIAALLPALVLSTALQDLQGLVGRRRGS